MSKSILAIIIIISCLSACKKSSPPEDTCHKHPISLKFGIMVANATGTWHVTPNVVLNTVDRPSYLLPTSNGKIVFTAQVSNFYGCDCQSNNIGGTNIEALIVDNNELSNVFYDSDTTGVNVPPIPFTAYVILGTDTIIKKQLIFPDPNPIYQGHSLIFLSGCLTKL